MKQYELERKEYNMWLLDILSRYVFFTVTYVMAIAVGGITGHGICGLVESLSETMLTIIILEVIFEYYGHDTFDTAIELLVNNFK